MRIIKPPSFEVIKCERCGTDFLPEPGDEFEYQFPPQLLMPPQVFIRCPVCRIRCSVIIRRTPEK